MDVIRRADEQHLPSQAAQVRRVDQSSPDVSRTTGTLISTHFYTRISTLHKLGFLQHFIVEGTTATGGDRIIKISVDCLTEFHLFSIAWVWESISESLCELRNHKWTAERPRKILWTAKSTKFAWQKKWRKCLPCLWYCHHGQPGFHSKRVIRPRERIVLGMIAGYSPQYQTPCPPNSTTTTPGEARVWIKEEHFCKKCLNYWLGTMERSVRFNTASLILFFTVSYPSKGVDNRAFVQATPLASL